MSVPVTTVSTDTSGETEITISREELINYPLMWRLTKQEQLEVVSFHVFVRPSNNISVMYITSDDSVYGMGENGYEVNILSLDGYDYRCDQVDRPRRVEELSGKRIKSIKVGAMVGAAVDEEGKLYYWGKDVTEWQGDRIILAQNGYRFPDARVVSFCCGNSLIAALDENGVVHTLGQYDFVNYCWCIQSYKFENPVVSLSCGLSHLAMVSDGQVYTCGIGSHGQRGFASCLSVFDHGRILHKKEEKVELSEPCKSVVCGPLSTYFVTTSGKLWACGANCGQYGYLGVASKEDRVKIPEEVRLDKEVKHLLASSNPLDYCTVLAFTDDGLYSWNGAGLGIPQKVNEEAHKYISATWPRNVMIRVQQPSPPKPLPLSVSLIEKLELASKLISDLRLESRLLEKYECPTEDPPNIDMLTLSVPEIVS